MNKTITDFFGIGEDWSYFDDRGLGDGSGIADGSGRL